MEGQVNDIHPHLRHGLILLSIVMVILACNFLEGPGVPTTLVPKGSTGEATQTAPVPQDFTSEATHNIPAGPDPLDRLLEMRSIQFNLIALQPDGTSRSVQGEIDSVGNMHLRLHTPVSIPSDLPEKFNRDLKLPEESELYVVDGKAYQPDDQNPAWLTEPVADDYEKELSGLLHGPDGPGLWLDLLPAGSLTPSGQESVGGFAADKYTINGSVHNQIITGSLWYESHALVRVELHIPAALFDLGKSATQGELAVTLEVQKAAVPPVVLPTPLAGATSRP
jgi:hypothetical protein